MCKNGTCRRYQGERDDEDTTEIITILIKVIKRVFRVLYNVYVTYDGKTRGNVQLNKRQPFSSSQSTDLGTSLFAKTQKVNGLSERL